MEQISKYGRIHGAVTDTLVIIRGNAYELMGPRNSTNVENPTGATAAQIRDSCVKCALSSLCLKQHATLCLLIGGTGTSYFRKIEGIESSEKRKINALMIERTAFHAVDISSLGKTISCLHCALAGLCVLKQYDICKAFFGKNFKRRVFRILIDRPGELG